MNHRASSVRNIRTIKALRGEILTIDLGKEITGGVLEAWMKKEPNSETYRSFDIVDSRKLVLSKSKTSDFYDTNNILVEAVSGRWYFDVEFTPDGGGPDDVKTIYTGTIIFINDITGSNGVELSETGTSFPIYTLSDIDINDNFSLLKNGVPVNTLSLSPYLNPQPTKTSDLTNDGADNTSTYVESDELGEVATSNDYNDLDSKPTIPTSILQLTDTPITFTGQAGKKLVVNVGETAVEFAADTAVSTERIAQWGSQGFRVYGNASGFYYGADNFPAYLNFDFSTGQSDANLINIISRRVVWQAPFDCTIENLYFNIPENDVCIAVVKTDQDHTNDTLVYENTDSAQVKNIRNGVSVTQINEGDFIAFLVKRPDATPSFLEAQVFIDFKEVI